MSPVWYGLVLLLSFAIAFLVFALTMTGWCAHQQWLSHSELRRSAGGENRSVVLNQTECVVCLTGFEDEEYLQQLPECRHSFHAPCIDMWLYSHSDCPLCRTPVQRGDSLNDSLTTEENSRGGLLDIRISS